MNLQLFKKNQIKKLRERCLAAIFWLLYYVGSKISVPSFMRSQNSTSSSMGSKISVRSFIGSLNSVPASRAGNNISVPSFTEPEQCPQAARSASQASFAARSASPAYQATRTWTRRPSAARARWLRPTAAQARWLRPTAARTLLFYCLKLI